MALIMREVIGGNGNPWKQYSFLRLRYILEFSKLPDSFLIEIESSNHFYWGDGVYVS